MKSFKEHLVEATTKPASNNEGHGYHGRAYYASSGKTTEEKVKDADKAFAKARAVVKKAWSKHDDFLNEKKPNVVVRDYLDSTFGRHLHDNGLKDDYITKDYHLYKKAK